MRTELLAAALIAATACGPTKPATSNEPMRPAGLYAEPARLAYTCVTPGCDEKVTTRITVSGDRRVAIKRILLTGGAASDFSFATNEKPPFIVGSAVSFNVDVTYTPKGAPLPGVAELRLTFTDASAEESPDRLEPGELVVPLVRRLVGEPILTINPGLLSFGVVEKGTTKTVPLKLQNTGFGNVVLELVGIDAGTAPLVATIPDPHALGADAGVDVPVKWSPTTEGFLSTQMEISVASPGVPNGWVKVEGTSLTQPQLAIEPDALIDFGEVVKGSSRTMQVNLMNQGGLSLRIDNISSNDTTGNFTAGADAGTPFSIPPLQRVPMSLLLKGNTPGDVMAQVNFLTNEPGSGSKTLLVKGTITEPRVTASPAMIDFGTVPMGWVVNKTIEVKNTGYGTLTIKNLSFVAGSSINFAIIGKPALPLNLKRDQRIAFDVELTAASASSFQGFVSIESNDPVTPFTEVPMSATVGTCAAGCPIANGTPNCMSGSCKVGTCNVGFFDTDNAAANGCECKEVGTDPGAFCADSTYVGSLKDTDHAQTTHTGIVPTKDDVDLIRFYAEDATQFFTDDYKVKVRLSSSDPGITMCVYRNNTGSHSPDCFYTNESCPSNGYYEKDGSFGTSDEADYIVKVTRTASSTPTCTPYTVFMSNGR